MADMRQAAGGGPEAQQRVVDDVRTVRRAPGEIFTRETICAIVRGQIAKLQPESVEGSLVLRDLLTIFENLE